jgi:DNA-binding PadR family transcriptional regulator
MSAYELAKSMRFSGTRYLWARTESRVYLEPPNLVEAGLAKVSLEHVGRRQRSVYSITSKGRKALQQWLDTPGSPPRVENEQLLKVFYANFGTIGQLREQLANIRQQISTEYEAFIEVLDRLAAHSHPVAERAHLTKLVVDHALAELAGRARWLLDTEAEVASWSVTTIDSATGIRVDNWFREAASSARAALEDFDRADPAGARRPSEA